MTIPEMISVLEAARDGKPIQWANNKPCSPWYDLDPGLSWDFGNYAYRVKPQPREWWVVVLEPGDMISTFKNKDMANLAAAGRRSPTAKVIHVREVVE